MDLLNFYFSMIFGGYGLPTPADVCANGEQIKHYCSGLLIGLNTVCALSVLSLIVVLSLRKVKFASKIFVLVLTMIPLGFWIVDYILKQLSDVATYGSDWFVVSFYVWWYLAVGTFLKAMLFGHQRAFTIGFLALTIIATIFFALTGRGTIEHITPLIGGMIAGFAFKYIWLSFVVKLIAVFLAIGFGVWVLQAIGSWVISGHFKGFNFKCRVLLVASFSAIALIPLISLPFGELLNKKDLRQAETFIDNVTDQIKKYKLENGEYPKTIEALFEKDDKYPRLLARHDYLSYGTKGAYYFSRADKYCFVFQNPARKLGYYSTTSTREKWKFSSYKGSLEEEYINVCDEQFAGSDNIIGGSLGLTDPYSEIEEMAAKVGATTMKPAISLKASQVLKGVINEYGKENPELFDKNSLKDGQIKD